MELTRLVETFKRVRSKISLFSSFPLFLVFVVGGSLFFYASIAFEAVEGKWRVGYMG